MSTSAPLAIELWTRKPSLPSTMVSIATSALHIFGRCLSASSSGFRASRISSTTPPGGHGRERCCLPGGLLLLRSQATAAEVHASAAETGAQHQSLVQTQPGFQCPGYEEPRRFGSPICMMLQCPSVLGSQQIPEGDIHHYCNGHMRA